MLKFGQRQQVVFCCKGAKKVDFICGRVCFVEQVVQVTIEFDVSVAVVGQVIRVVQVACNLAAQRGWKTILISLMIL